MCSVLSDVKISDHGIGNARVKHYIKKAAEPEQDYGYRHGGICRSDTYIICNEVNKKVKKSEKNYIFYVPFWMFVRYI